MAVVSIAAVAALLINADAVGLFTQWTDTTSLMYMEEWKYGHMGVFHWLSFLRHYIQHGGCRSICLS